MRLSARKAECRRSASYWKRHRTEELCLIYKIPLIGKDSRKYKLFPCHPYWINFHNSYDPKCMSKKELYYFKKLSHIMFKCLTNQINKKEQKLIFLKLKELENTEHSNFMKCYIELSGILERKFIINEFKKINYSIELSGSIARLA